MPTTQAEHGAEEMTAADRLRQELEELDHRFAGHEDDELMVNLKEIVRAHIARPPGED